MRKWRWHLTALGGLLVVALVLVFTVGGDRGEQPAPGPRPPQDAPRVLVALGDSTISGEGAGDYEPGTNGENGDWCHRSRNASIHQTGLPDIAMTISLACSGANSAQVGLGDAKQYTEPSQASRLAVVARQQRVLAVVVAVGANDDPAFSHTMNDCVQAWFDPGDPGCGSIDRDWRRRIDAMVPKVAKSVTDIKKVAEQAHNLYGRIDYLINNAGYNQVGGLEELSYGDPSACFMTRFLTVSEPRKRKHSSRPMSSAC